MLRFASALLHQPRRHRMQHPVQRSGRNQWAASKHAAWLKHNIADNDASCADRFTNTGSRNQVRFYSAAQEKHQHSDATIHQTLMISVAMSTSTKFSGFLADVSQSNLSRSSAEGRSAGFRSRHFRTKSCSVTNQGKTVNLENTEELDSDLGEP